MNSQLDGSSGPLKDALKGNGDNMSENFGKITALVCTQLGSIISENTLKQKEDQEAGVYEPSENYNLAEDINNQDLIAEIATEEFISKNIRVRPVSGANFDNQDANTEFGQTKGLLSGDLGNHMDEEEKFNANVNIDMLEQRHKVKQNKINFELEQVKAAERLAKAAKAKK
jgi:hypothetical protein